MNAAFLLLQFGFVIFWLTNIGAKAPRKMSMNNKIVKVSILSTIYEQLLHAWTSKVQKDTDDLIEF
jgi:hypothetical protein